METLDDPHSAVRHQLIKLCSSKRSRSSKFTAKAPCDFNPGKVVNPEGSGEPFTEEGAWLFIVSCLERGEPLDANTLQKPAGRTGSVMLVPGASGQPAIYIKLQLGSGVVLCRSFHESKVGNMREE